MPGYHVYCVLLQQPNHEGTTIYVSRASHAAFDVYAVDVPITAITFPIDYARRLSDYYGDQDRLYEFVEHARRGGALFEELWVCGSYDDHTLDLYRQFCGSGICYSFKLFFTDAVSRQPTAFYKADRSEYVGVYHEPTYEEYYDEYYEEELPAPTSTPTPIQTISNDDAAAAGAPTTIPTTDSIDGAAIATDDAAVAEAIATGL